MASYKVNRRILHDGLEYKPGSEIELTEKQAAQMKDGQVTLIPAAPKPAPKPAVPTPPAAPKPAAPGTDKDTAPVQ
jgi:hypothetical protein